MAGIDTAPFLSNTGATPNPSSVRAEGLRHAARVIRLASTGRRGMREPSMAVRETAAQEIEDRQVDWAYSLPVVALDVAWNSAFIAAAVTVLFLSRSQSPRLPLRLWAACYALQCVVHVVCVCVEFRRRRRRWPLANDNGGGQGSSEASSVIRHLESANTMFSFIWWMIGFGWICVGGRALQQDSPILYWLCIVFLVLDLFFFMFCVALASVIAAAVCCCLPFIIAILYVLADRLTIEIHHPSSYTFLEQPTACTPGFIRHALPRTTSLGGASKEDIELLPKYTFHRTGDEQIESDESPGPCEGIMTECEADSPIVRSLTAEDAECCICLSAYEESVELRELPCGHHFHCSCVDKWLYINSTCPLCKFDISKRYTRDEEV